MKCVKCGTEYEGNECPRCNGPVIKINSSDYMARRKAYEESLARKEIQKVLDSAEEACNVLSGESEQSDKDGKTIQQGKRAKKRSNKVKNYDEGVFDITKVDFNDVADKLKAGSEKLASKAKGKAQQEKAKTRKNNNAKTDNNVKADNNIKMDSRIRPQTKHSYKKAGVAVAIVIVAIAAISLIMAVLLRKNSYIYMSDGSRIYDVSYLVLMKLHFIHRNGRKIYLRTVWFQVLQVRMESIMRQMCIMMKMSDIHYMYGHRMEVWKL